MAQHIVETQKAIFTVRYRAVCKNSDYTGWWRSNKLQAQKDALNHQNGNQSHEVKIEVEQKQHYLIDLE